MSRIQCLESGETSSLIRTEKESHLCTMVAQLTYR